MLTKYGTLSLEMQTAVERDERPLQGNIANVNDIQAVAEEDFQEVDYETGEVVNENIKVKNEAENAKTENVSSEGQVDF